MNVLIAFSIIHPDGNFVSSIMLESSLIHEPVTKRYLEWASEEIRKEYVSLNPIVVRILSLQMVAN